MTAGGPGGGRGDAGAGAVLVVAVLAVAVVLAASAAVLAQVTAARHRADVAADLGALAAADVLVGRAAGDPCERAARVVAANGAQLRRCRTHPERSASTQAAIRPGGVAAAFGEAVGRARAGPASPGRP